MRRISFLLLLVTMLTVVLAVPAAPAGAQAGDSVARAGSPGAEVTSRVLSRWLTVVILALALVIVVTVWQVWNFSRRRAELDAVRVVLEKRLSELTDEILRLKRRQADTEGIASRLEVDVASVRPGGTADTELARLAGEVMRLTKRLEHVAVDVQVVTDRTVGPSDSALREIAATAKTVDAARIAAEEAASRAEKALALSQVDALLHAGDEALAHKEYSPAVESYSRCAQTLQLYASDNPKVLFHALHNRAVANLRLGQFDAVLTDAVELAGRAGEDAKAAGAARLLSAVARLGQGMVDEAIAEFARAVKVDPGARAVIAGDEDIAAWLDANPRLARAVRRQLMKLAAPRRKVKPQAPSRKPQTTGHRPKLKPKRKR
jgi:tetratricopeptide (TPR) repeat protein